MKARTKRILNLALILGTLAIVLIIGISDQDIGSAIEAVKGLGFRFVLAAIACYLGFVALDAASIHYFLRSNGYRVPFSYLLFVSIAGQYYSNITPGASGGQPMQIYHLRRRGVPTAIATSALVVRFISFQAMLSVLGTVFWIAYGGFVAQNVGSHLWILLVGYIYNTLMVTGLLVLVLYQPIINWFVRKVVHLGAKLRLVKHPEQTTSRSLSIAASFHDSMKMVVSKRGHATVQLLIGGAQLMALMSVIWFVYSGLGLKGASYGQLVSLNLMEYLSAAYTPLPGASGATEGVFSLYFGKVFPDGLCFAALLLWRFFTYYFSLLLGAVVVTIGGLRSGKPRLEDVTEGAADAAADAAEADESADAAEAADPAEAAGQGEENGAGEAHTDGPTAQ